MTSITIFTSPKPFTNPHIATIQRNAIMSWKSLGRDVNIFLVGDEDGAGEVANEFSVGFIPDVARNTTGTPLISSIFSSVYEQANTSLFAYVNADILLMKDFLTTAKMVESQCEKFLIVGQRWDLEVNEALDFSLDWETQLRKKIQSMGKLHLPSGSDYFIYPGGCFKHIPDFAIGRAGWDNWMFYEARGQNWQVINATGSIDIVHQKHDYSHLPNGQRHYRLPETNENIRLAGGRRTIFTLIDTNYWIDEGKVKRIRLNWAKFWREVEIFPLISLQSRWLSQVFYAIFHPQKAFGELRVWVKRKKK